MKTFIISIVVSLLSLGASAQLNPPVTGAFQTPSNMRIEMRPGHFSPVSLGPNYLPGLFIDDYINELAHQQDVAIANVTANTNFLFPEGSPIMTNGYNVSYGKFHFVGPSDVGIDTGIIINSGWAYYGVAIINPQSNNNGPGFNCGVLHPAAFHSSGGNWGVLANFPEPPDSVVQRGTQYPELVALNDGDSIWDARVLEFDVTPKGNFLSLDYVFASEEWPLYHCQPRGTDVMGIFLSGPGIVGQKNIALLPGTNTPVNPHTVFPPNSPCHPWAPQGSPYYVDNTGGQNIIYNGFTTVLRAAAIVQPCQTYRLKIMIADGAVHQFDTTWKLPTFTWESFMDMYGWESTMKRMLHDSGIMLKLRSLRSMDSVRLQALGGTAATAQYPYAVRGCLNGKLRLSSAQTLPVDRSFQLQLGGDAVAGTDYQPFPTTVVLPAGDSTVDIDVVALAGAWGTRTLEARIISPYGACSGWGPYLDSTVLTIADGYHVTVTPADTAVAPGTGVQLMASGEPFLTYEWSPSAYLDQYDIPNPVSTPYQDMLYTVTGYPPPSYPCPAGTNQVFISTSGVGVEDVDGQNALLLKTNPSSTHFTLQGGSPGDSYRMQVLDAQGRSRGHASGTIQQLNAYLQKAELTAGTYLLQIEDKRGRKQGLKAVKL